MAKTKALTWQNIFNDTKFHDLAKALDIPVEELTQRTNKDKMLPRESIDYFFKKALSHIEMATLTYSEIKNSYNNMHHTHRMAITQNIYEQIGFANEFLFKALVTVEYKGFNKEHTIKKLYEKLEDKELKNLISESVIESQWDSIDKYTDFIDNIVPSGRRYFSYEFCSTFEDFIANRWSQAYPIIDKQKVGVESLSELFMKIYKLADKKASQMYNNWNTFIETIKKQYPERFEKLNKQWKK